MIWDVFDEKKIYFIVNIYFRESRFSKVFHEDIIINFAQICENLRTPKVKRDLPCRTKLF